jgi:hypothetical protein
MNENERLEALVRAYIETRLPMADLPGVGKYPAWNGWALRAAWLAGYRTAQADQREKEAKE